jgi:plasmid stability protein
MNTFMPNLSVRKLDEETFAMLRIQAARHGVSMEEEARRILRRAVRAPARLGDLAQQLFGDKYGVELDLPDRPAHEPFKLER